MYSLQHYQTGTMIVEHLKRHSINLNYFLHRVGCLYDSHCVSFGAVLPSSLCMTGVMTQKSDSS